MGLMQYMKIASTIMSVPHKPVRLGRDGNPRAMFVDDIRHYAGIRLSKDAPLSTSCAANDTCIVGPRRGLKRGNEGPSVLFWGCGRDVVLWRHIVDFLGGELAFVDNSEKWAAVCRAAGADELYVVEHTGSPEKHLRQMQKKVRQDGSSNRRGNPFFEKAGDAFALEKIALPHNLTRRAWDVIVVDGPDQTLGRSQSLYSAVRLAQAAHPNHYTHLFFHDSARNRQIALANAMVGHSPRDFLGNTLPRKGLKHWRLAGDNRPWDDYEEAT